MLFISDSLQKYIQSCRNIYCLPLLLLHHSENCNKHVLFWHSTVLRISPVAPSSPPVPTQHQYWLPLAWRQPVVWGAEKEIIICTHSDQTQRITQVHSADWHAENKKMWCARMKRAHLNTMSTVQHTCTYTHTSKWISRLQLKCDGTWWRMEEVKGKLANGVCSQYSSHHLWTWYIQQYYRWCAHLRCQ